MNYFTCYIVHYSTTCRVDFISILSAIGWIPTPPHASLFLFTRQFLTRNEVHHGGVVGESDGEIVGDFGGRVMTIVEDGAGDKVVG